MVLALQELCLSGPRYPQDGSEAFFDAEQNALIGFGLFSGACTAPVFTIPNFTLPAGTNVVISITSVAAKVYQLQSRNLLGMGDWSNVAGTAAIGLGGPLSLTDPGGILQAQRFYRVVITP